MKRIFSLVVAVLIAGSTSSAFASLGPDQRDQNARALESVSFEESAATLESTMSPKIFAELSAIHAELAKTQPFVSVADVLRAYQQSPSLDTQLADASLVELCVVVAIPVVGFASLAGQILWKLRKNLSRGDGKCDEKNSLLIEQIRRQSAG